MPNGDNFTHAHIPTVSTDPKIYLWGGVADVINCANFIWKSVEVFQRWQTPKMASPIDLVQRPYNNACRHYRAARWSFAGNFPDIN